jgi:phage-related protein
MREIKFYRSSSGRCPIEDYLDSLSGKQVQKVAWVLQIIEELEVVPTKYFKKLVNTDDIWEVRVQLGNNIFRLLGFFQDEQLVILTNGFTKKDQKTPKNEIELAEQRKKEYLSRKEIENE